MTRPQTLTVRETSIPGLLLVDLPVHGDSRGWFKENWQREKMVTLGLPDFEPVQNNMSYNADRGATRGLHAEPWDKFVSIAHGKVLGAWVDLREGASFGESFYVELGPDQAVFVPRGVANGYQALADDTVYSYLVNAHWSPAARAEYTYVNLADQTVGIPWPIPLDQATISQADLGHPNLQDVAPMADRKILITGASGQLGSALQDVFPNAIFLDREDLDFSEPGAVEHYTWDGVGTIINAAAWTAVDAAETAEGRRSAWAINVHAVASLVAVARRHRITLVHISSDYVFDGAHEEHDETERFSPLSVYGASKAAGDTLVETLPSHYILRTSWVVGAGKNFVRTMSQLARAGRAPAVVDDQFGRLTFTSTLAEAIAHLVTNRPPFGTYNVTNDGPIMSWFEIARAVFELEGYSPDLVSAQSTADHFGDRVAASRPRHSALRLDKLKSVGFEPAPAMDVLRNYLGQDHPE